MKNFRCSKLLKLAQECPHCMHCGKPNRGDVVGCHSNRQHHGKGMGIKAHDLVAYLCRECHDLLDGRTGHLTRCEQNTMFLESLFDSQLWLYQSEHLEVK